MAREKRGELKRPSIMLDMNNADHVRVWEYWQELSKRGKAAEWAILALVDAVPTDDTHKGHISDTERAAVESPVSPLVSEKREPSQHVNRHASVHSRAAKLEVQAPQHGQLSPAEQIAQRKAEARQRLDRPDPRKRS